MAALVSKALVCTIPSSGSGCESLSGGGRRLTLTSSRRAKGRETGAQVASSLAKAPPFARLDTGPGDKVRGSGSWCGSRRMSFSDSPGDEERGRDISRTSRVAGQAESESPGLGQEARKLAFGYGPPERPPVRNGRRLKSCAQGQPLLGAQWYSAPRALSITSMAAGLRNGEFPVPEFSVVSTTEK